MNRSERKRREHERNGNIIIDSSKNDEKKSTTYINRKGIFSFIKEIKRAINVNKGKTMEEIKEEMRKDGRL